MQQASQFTQAASGGTQRHRSGDVKLQAQRYNKGGVKMQAKAATQKMLANAQ